MELYYLWLQCIKWLGPYACHQLVRNYGTPEHIYRQRDELVPQGEVSARLLQLLKAGAEQAMEQAKRIQERCFETGILILTYDDPHYEDNIRKYLDFPLVFFVKGIIRDNWTHGIGIVGARRCTPQGKEYAIRLTQNMVNQGYPIISGMAKGIDSYAHTAAINCGGYTVAVLGHGLDMCYPPEHELLMEHIVDQGLILSEYPPGIRPNKYTFPQRNRIIAGLSNVVYIVDAGSKSGTESTIEAAQRYGKLVDKIERFDRWKDSEEHNDTHKNNRH